MFDLNTIIDVPPFSLKKEEKEKLYDNALSELSQHHYSKCLPYKKVLDILNFETSVAHKTEEFPFLPVRLFKEYELLSVERSEVIKTMTSSGTSGQQVSKIFLDRHTAKLQSKALTKIVSDFIGKKRLPMLVIDSKSVVKDRRLFSARGAGILGFSMLGRDVTYALDENMQIDIPTVEGFCEKYKGENILLFGFTFMVWKHFYKELVDKDHAINLENGILIHGGGWKKLIAETVDNETFKKMIEGVCKMRQFHNYYGMVEQTGSIFMECEKGYLHSSIFSDVIIRRFSDFSECDFGEKGLIELVSLLPSSYPGHAILSEDIGEKIGVDDCTCGRFGSYFRIHGRIKKAEIRGCSDTYN